jgi:hypothetical protein
MSTTITAGNATNGLAFSPDSTGQLEIKTGTGSGTTAVTVSSAQAVTLAAGLSGTTGSFSGNMSFNSGYGSAAVAYGCRAWVNFNGTGTVAIRASGNVSSITDVGTGTYTTNLTTAMPDINYAPAGSCSPEAGTVQINIKINFSRVANASVAPTVSAFTVSATNDSNGLAYDPPYVSLSVFR